MLRRKPAPASSGAVVQFGTVWPVGACPCVVAVAGPVGVVVGGAVGGVAGALGGAAAGQAVKLEEPKELPSNLP